MASLLNAETHLCKLCNKAQDTSQFNKCSRRKSGLDNRCKSCKKAQYLLNQNEVKQRASNWKKNNPEKRLINNRRWVELNKAKDRKIKLIYATNRRLLEIKSNKINPELTDFVFEEAIHLAQLRGKVLGGNWHVDHIIPLKHKTICGLHTWNNFQVIPEKLNVKKGNRSTKQYSWGEFFVAT